MSVSGPAALFTVTPHSLALSALFVIFLNLIFPTELGQNTYRSERGLGGSVRGLNIFWGIGTIKGVEGACRAAQRP